MQFLILLFVCRPLQSENFVVFSTAFMI